VKVKLVIIGVIIRPLLPVIPVVHDIMGRGFDIPCIVSVKISWVGYLIFHG
jgi:hypothetical protein